MIGLILVCENGLIRKVTTFEALNKASIPAELSEETQARVWLQIEETLAPPAAVLLCSSDGFEEWIRHGTILNAEHPKEKRTILCEIRTHRR